MSEWRPRPLRSLRHEAISLLELAIIPAAIAFAFPYEAVGFRADVHESGRKPSCAFVILTDEEERVALAAARTAWQVDAKGVKWMKPESGPGELPPMPVVFVIPERPVRGTSAAPAEYAPNMLPPTVAAPPPAAIAPDAVSDHASKQAFSKEELLKID